MKAKVTVWGLMFLAGLSGTELEARYVAKFGGTSPGVQIPEETPDCWFSFAEKQAVSFVQTPGILYSPELVGWNAQGQLTEYFRTGTHTVSGGSESVTAHLFDAVRNGKNQITGWTEIRYYSKSQRTYMFQVSGVLYTGDGVVLNNYKVAGVTRILLSGTILTPTGTGIAGVTVTGQSAGFQSAAHTSSAGFYEIAVPTPWAGTLTPTLENTRFEPASKSYSSVTQNLINQNFTGTQIFYLTISGVIQDSGGVGVAGVALDGFLEPVTTDASGVYSGRVESGTTPVIRPVSACYAFTPEWRIYADIDVSRIHQDFSAARTGIVPNVVGKTWEQADADILAAGLLPGMLHFAFNPTAAFGTVVRQSPAAGVCGGGVNSVVHRVVSRGPRPAGTLKAWGHNGSGQCTVPAGTNFTAVAGGGAHAVALKDTGALAAWGDNTSGQCTVPAGVFANVACGAEFSLGIKPDGTLAAWGKSTDGQTTVPTGNDFIAIGAGDKHGLALRIDGTLAAWGSNASGQCTVPAGHFFYAADGGEEHTVAVTGGYGLMAWGANDAGQCNVPDGNDFIAVAAGGRHTVALRGDGSLAAWGANGDGQCNVPAGNDFIAIAAGKTFSAALTTDFGVIAWGKNDLGQCNAPQAPSFTAMDAGAEFGAGVYILRSDLDNNWTIDLDDWTGLVPAWMSQDCQAPQWCGMADLDHNGRVDLGDLAILSREWMAGVAAIPAGLIAHWMMDDTAASKTVVDSGGGNHNGVAQQNTAALTTAGKLNGALAFNGTSDWIDCGTNAALLPDAWTVCAWVKCAETATPMLISFGGNYPSVKLQNNAKGKPLIHLGASNYRYFAAAAWTTLMDGQWHHVAVSVPGKGQADIEQAKLYLDGASVDGEAAMATGPQTSKSHVYLGANPSGTQRFGGAMDDVTLFGRALTENEIRRVMNRQP
jgi:hypothetical protein